MPFIIIFIVVPFAELAVFASVSEHIGIWTTLGMAFLTAIIGGALVKYQGLQTLMAMKNSMDRGQMPLNEIFDGFCLVAAGALLITPGFITDAIGFSFLVPNIRRFLRHIIRTHTSWAVSSGGAYYEQRRPFDDADIIEGEYDYVDDGEKPDKRQIDEAG